MPVRWNVTGVVICDVCGAQLHTAGESRNECVVWIKQAHWTYRWPTITGERRLIVRCPLHRESYDEEKNRWNC